MTKEEVLFRIGKKIKDFRIRNNMSQQDLAAACDFEKSNMSRIEAGKSNLTIGTLLKICQVLQIKLSEVTDIQIED